VPFFSQNLSIDKYCDNINDLRACRLVQKHTYGSGSSTNYKESLGHLNAYFSHAAHICAAPFVYRCFTNMHDI